MREILFRGKRIDNGEWEYGNYISFSEDRPDSDLIVHAIVTGYLATTNDIAECCIKIIDENTLGQFSGFYDKNHVCIFEGDIIKSDMWYTGIATFKDGHFCIKRAGKKYDIYILESDDAEVIGNIYDNPNLLGGDT